MANIRVNLADPKEVVSCKTIGDVVYWLKKLDIGEDIGEGQLGDLKKIVEALCERLGIRGVIDIEKPSTRSMVLSLLKDVAFDTSIDGVEEGVSEEKSELGSKQISGPELEKLVKEYEDALVKEETERARLIADKIRGYGFKPEDLYNVEGWIEEERRKREGLTQAAEEVEREKIILINELKNEGAENAQGLVEKATKLISTEMMEPVVDMKKVRTDVGKIFKGVKNSETRAIAKEEVLKVAATARVKEEVGKVAKRLIEGLEKEEDVVVPAENRDGLIRLVEGRMEMSLRQNLPLSIVEKTENEEADSSEAGPGPLTKIFAITGNEGDQKVGRVAVKIRKAEEELKKIKKKNLPVFKIWEIGVLKERIFTVLQTDKKNEGVEVKILEKWSGLVARLAQNNSSAELRVGMEIEANKTDMGPGRAEEIYSRIKVVHSLLSGGGIKEKIAVFRQISNLIPNLSAANGIREVRAVNEVMSALEMPDMVNTIMAARKRIGGIRGLIKSFGAGGMDRVGLDLSKKVGSQPLMAFTQNAVALISKEGFSKGLGLALKGLISTGKVAAGAGGIAGAGGAAVAAGAGPPGWAVAAVMVGVAVGKKIVKKVEEIAEKLGLSLGIKKWMRENLGKIPGGILGFGASLVTAAMTVTAGAMATATVVVAPIIICVFGGLLLYPIIFQSSMISSLVGPVNMGSGVGAEVEENLPDLAAEAVTCEGGGGASVRDKVVEGIKQNRGDWANKSLPGGCVFADSGCGPTAVAGVLMRKDGNLTPDKLVNEKGSPYSKLGCDGSTMTQARESLEKHHDGKVTFNAVTRSCNKQDIANWICEGKLVMVLANFYKNTDLEIGGHYFLAVEVKSGEVYSVDPFYEDGAVMDGTRKYGQVQAIRDCMVIEVN